MLSISSALTRARLNSKCGLVPFITAGYPNFKSSIDILNLLDQQGASVIELGIPYSDALADGPIIQAASYAALKQEIYLEKVLKLLYKVSADLQAPIAIFTYYNLVLSRGIAVFIKSIATAGAKGLIIPDLPVEEADYIIELCKKYNIELILFVSPSSSKSRILSIISKSPGCIYLVTRYGVTGTRDYITDKLQSTISYIKQSTNKLVMLGFGISNETQVQKIAHWDIDGIVIGSAFIQTIANNPSDQNYKKLAEFCKKIKEAIIT